MIIMAISLKNIEDRVKTLETKIATTGVGGIVYLGYINEGKSFAKLAQYNQYLVQTTIPTVKEFNSMILVDFSRGLSGTWQLAEYYNEKGRLGYVNFSNSTIVCDYHSHTGRMYIYGLKLYYNFSYNIIYKILSSIKFKISQIISSPKITRR